MIIMITTTYIHIYIYTNDNSEHNNKKYNCFAKVAEKRLISFYNKQLGDFTPPEAEEPVLL